MDYHPVQFAHERERSTRGSTAYNPSRLPTDGCSSGGNNGRTSGTLYPPRSYIYYWVASRLSRHLRRVLTGLSEGGVGRWIANALSEPRQNNTTATRVCSCIKWNIVFTNSHNISLNLQIPLQLLHEALFTKIVLQLFWILSGTTRVSWYQKGKTRKVKPIWIYWSKR